MNKKITVHSNPWFRVENQDGHYIVHEPKSVSGAAVLIKLEDDTIVMVTQHRFGTGQVMLEIPRGYAENNETPIECAIRESYEETGFRLNTNNVKVIGRYSPNSSLLTSTISIVLANATKAMLDTDAILDETDSVNFIALKEVEQRIASGDITDGFTISAMHFHHLQTS